MSKILIEKIAMRAEQKRYIAKKFGVIPEGGWKSVIRDLRDDKGRALSREQGEKAILKHRYLTQDEWDKKVRAHNVNNTHEYGGVIDKKSGKFLQDKLVKGERHSVTTPWDSNDRQRTSSKMDFHLHGNESERFSRHYMAKKISNSNAERYEIARESGAITKPEGWERKRHIAEIEWDRRHSGGHRMTGLS